MADFSRPGSSTNDPDDKNRRIERIVLGAAGTSSSSDTPKEKSSDQKSLRRLAQNREAARKSRLRKKAYVQQLESSRMKLTQLEQDLQGTRQKVFSETFSESKWCLHEVKRMVDSKKTIVPIFYKVSVDDVKIKSPTYKKIMQKHEKKYGKEEVNKWKAALTATTMNKGRVFSNQFYPDFCKEFVSEERFGKLLDEHCSIDTLGYICVHGMGGIGKIVLCREIISKFSGRFERWKLIENVRVKCSVPGVVTKLKEDLRSIKGKKVLIVLDDVDEGNQIISLVDQDIGYRRGSVIIVTTREKDIFQSCRRVVRDQIIYFEMDFLQPQDALRLFCKMTFDGDTPPDDFESLSDEVVKKSGGLPLSLIVMGSLLRGQNKEMWEDVIERSNDILDKNAKKVLKISYDKLDNDQQQILPNGSEEPSRMMAMWEACKFHRRYSLSVLESKSLIKKFKPYEGKYEIWIQTIS